MRRSRLRWVFLILGLVLPAAVQAATSETGPLAPYSAPGQLVEVAPGRQINMICLGQGSPTVVLSAGGASWSLVWWRVQPVLARSTRVCAWDRAGNGFSSASGEPQDLAHTERDLEAALDRAGVTGPLVMVGHSLGGLESLVFADRRPERVTGMVLVDPSFPDNRRRLFAQGPAAMAVSDRSDAQYYAGVSRCIQALAAPSDVIPEPCRVLRSSYPKGVQEALAARTRDPAYWRTYLSDYERRDDKANAGINPRRRYGDMLLIVLGSGRLALPGAPPEAQAQLPALKAEIERGQKELAALSARGRYDAVPDSGHAIHMQKPEIVVKAIEEVVADARGDAAR